MVKLAFPFNNYEDNSYIPLSSQYDASIYDSRPNQFPLYIGSSYALNEETIYRLLNSDSFGPQMYWSRSYSSPSYTSSNYPTQNYPSNYQTPNFLTQNYRSNDRKEYQSYEPKSFSSRSYSSPSYPTQNYPSTFDNYNKQPGYAVVYMLVPVVVPV